MCVLLNSFCPRVDFLNIIRFLQYIDTGGAVWGSKFILYYRNCFFSPNFFVYFSADVELMTPTLKKSKSKKPKHSPKPKSRKKDDRTETNGDRKTLHEVPAPCSGCGERLETKLLMEKHKKDCSTNNIICSICDKSFRTETQVFYF